MDEPTKIFLKKAVTVLFVLASLYAIFIFSVIGSIGAWTALYEPDPVLDEDYVIPILAIIIGLIILIPILRLIFKAPPQRWKVTLNSFLLLWPYLIGGLIIVFGSLFIASHFNFLSSNRIEGLILLCQIISPGLAIGYYFYFKKVIKPLALKTKV